MKKERWVGAYMTVEVSLLFPTIFMVLICLMYLVFFSYNDAISYQNSAISVLYGKLLNSIEREEQADKVYAILETLNQNQYIAEKYHKQKVCIEGKSIVVEQSGCINIPLFSEKRSEQIRYISEITVKVTDPVFYIRQVRKVESDEK